MNEISTLRRQNQYNLKNSSDFCVPKIRAAYHGSERFRYLAPKNQIQKTNLKLLLKRENQNFVRVDYENLICTG